MATRENWYQLYPSQRGIYLTDGQLKANKMTKEQQGPTLCISFSKVCILKDERVGCIVDRFADMETITMFSCYKL